MTAKSIAGAFVGLLLMTTAPTLVRAADMSDQRTLNVQHEPRNRLLHRGSYVGTIDAPPISDVMNGKRNIAVLMDSRRSQDVISFSPEPENTSIAAMRFVFSL